MNNELRDLMAQIEAWESAVEFGVPESMWVEFEVRQRSDDLYISSVSAIFDALRNDSTAEKKLELSALAKTLLVYSKSAASRYLIGVESDINLLYSAALFYLADYPATAALVSNRIELPGNFSNEEKFLFHFLSRTHSTENEMQNILTATTETDEDLNLQPILSKFKNAESEGLKNDPRQYISSKLAVNCLQRFEEFNTWNALRRNTSNFSAITWQPFLNNSNVLPMWELFPSQLTALKSGILGQDNNVFSLQMPTSSGKTSFCEILIFHEVKVKKKRVLFLGAVDVRDSQIT